MSHRRWEATPMCSCCSCNRMCSSKWDRIHQTQWKTSKSQVDGWEPAMTSLRTACEFWVALLSGWPCTVSGSCLRLDSSDSSQGNSCKALPSSTAKRCRMKLSSWNWSLNSAKRPTYSGHKLVEWKFRCIENGKSSSSVVYYDLFIAVKPLNTFVNLFDYDANTAIQRFQVSVGDYGTERILAERPFHPIAQHPTVGRWAGLQFEKSFDGR